MEIILVNECSSLSDIKALQNWNVSNGKNFNFMFYGCFSILDIKVLQNWNISNGNDYNDMFNQFSSFLDIKAKPNYRISNINDFNDNFYELSSCFGENLFNELISKLCKFLNTSANYNYTD